MKKIIYTMTILLLIGCGSSSSYFHGAHPISASDIHKPQKVTATMMHQRIASGNMDDIDNAYIDFLYTEKDPQTRAKIDLELARMYLHKGKHILADFHAKRVLVNSKNSDLTREAIAIIRQCKKKTK